MKKNKKKNRKRNEPSMEKEMEGIFFMLIDMFTNFIAFCINCIVWIVKGIKRMIQNFKDKKNKAKGLDGE